MIGSNGKSGRGGGTNMPETTGRYLVLMRQDAVQEGIQTLSETAGFRVTRSLDFEDGAVPSETLAESEAVVFDDLAVAVVEERPDQIQVLGAAAGAENAIIAVEPERVVYALESDFGIIESPTMNGSSLPAAETGQSATGAELTLPADYLYGYRDAVNHLVEQVLARAGVPAVEEADTVGEVEVEADVTWGLRLTRTAVSRYTGKGVRVAVLDTGFDFGHPDFSGRAVTGRSFIPGESPQDGHGHGTHCIGTACGPCQPGQLPRYGVATEAEIFVGKVLSNRGSGSDSGILAGIQWAIRSRCAVISMSLGAAARPGQHFSRIFETVAQRALARGTLIIAAAGNESNRPRSIAPVGHPANCPSIMAVAAVNASLEIAPFSCAGINLQGGQVDIAGPGVAVRSSWPRPHLYHTISGTSMATPHVAGIAALYAEQNPDVRGGPLGWLLLQSARRLNISSRDAGSGLVQAP